VRTIVAHLKGGAADGRVMRVGEVHRVRIPVSPLVRPLVLDRSPPSLADLKPNYEVVEYEPTFHWTLDNGEQHAIYDLVP
jgi:hypothetical protein